MWTAFNFCAGTNGRHPEAGSNKWCVFVRIPFWSAQQETCVTWRLQPPSQSSSSPNTLLPPSSEREVRRRGGGGEKDHPHWDHSPSIRPFHTLWTWNNQGLIAAVCLCRPWLIAGRLTVLRPIGFGRDRGEQSRQAWRCSRGHISKDTHKHSFYLFIPCYSLLSSSSGFPAILTKRRSAPSDRWCQGLVFEFILVHLIEFLLFTNYWGALFTLRVVIRGHCLLAHCSEWILATVVVLVVINEPSFIATEPSEYHNGRPQSSSMPVICIHWKYLHKIRLH